MNNKLEKYKAELTFPDKDKSELKPKCIFENQELTLSSMGYFTPCCFLDDELYRNQPWVKSLFKEHLKLQNNEKVEDIFKSKEWTDFYNMLKNNPKDAPPVCYKFCSKGVITYKKTKKDEINQYNKIETIIRH